MLDKLKALDDRYREIEQTVIQPEVAADPERLSSLMKEYKILTPVVETYRSYRGEERRREEAEAILSDATSDAELRGLATEELLDAKAKAEELLPVLRQLLIPRDPEDDKNTVVEIRACAGGEEAALFAADLFRMYSMYAAKMGFTVSVMSRNPTDLGGFREIVFGIRGSGVYRQFKFESGVHRVQRIPLTESGGRIQTSTATVAVLPEADEVEVKIDPRDIRFETCKSSGAGGQHINKTESAVRLIHQPTGIVIECDSERSQFQNKDTALRLLRTKLYDIRRQQRDDRISAERRSQIGSGDRSEKIRTYNYPQSRVTDHRIGMTVYTLDAFMNGDIGGMIEELLARDAAERMKQETT